MPAQIENAFGYQGDAMSLPVANLRYPAGIEAVEDLIADLAQALS